LTLLHQPNLIKIRWEYRHPNPLVLVNRRTKLSFHILDSSLIQSKFENIVYSIAQ
jgi:hypothetical protein